MTASATPAASAMPPLHWAAMPARSALLVEGADAVRFLDNFTTASLAPLAVGRGTEGFFADARGHVIAVAAFLRTPGGIWIDAAPELAPRLREHLEHYHIREAVSFRDVSAARAAFLLHGRDAAAWLARHSGVVPPQHALAHTAATLGDVPTTLVATDWYGPDGCLVITASAARSASPRAAISARRRWPGSTRSAT